MSHSGQYPRTITARQLQNLSLDFHDSLSGQHVEKLLRLFVMVPEFRSTRRHTLFDDA